eukprot:5998896-Amphidinium_carterae.1
MNNSAVYYAIDNLAALPAQMTLISCTPGTDNMLAMLKVVVDTDMSTQARSWYVWTPAASNPADDLSRFSLEELEGSGATRDACAAEFSSPVCSFGAYEFFLVRAVFLSGTALVWQPRAGTRVAVEPPTRCFMLTAWSPSLRAKACMCTTTLSLQYFQN